MGLSLSRSLSWETVCDVGTGLHKCVRSTSYQKITHPVHLPQAVNPQPYNREDSKPQPLNDNLKLQTPSHPKTLNPKAPKPQSPNPPPPPKTLNPQDLTLSHRPLLPLSVASGKSRLPRRSLLVGIQARPRGSEREGGI